MGYNIRIREKATGKVYEGDPSKLPPDYQSTYEILPAEAPTMGLLPGRMPAPTTIPGHVGEAIKTGALPMLGAMAGQAIGTPFGLPGRITGEAAGSVAGTGANMALGLEPPSLGGLAKAAVMPFAGRVVGGLGRGGVALGAPMLPGASAALHEAAAGKMTSIPNLIRPGTASSVLYEQVAQHNPPIGTRNLAGAIDDLLAKEARTGPTLASKTISDVAEGLKSEISSGALPFQDYWARVQRLGQKVGKLGREGGEEYGAMKALFKAAQKDLDDAAASGAGPAVTALRAANATYKKELARDALEEYVAKQGVNIRSADNLVYVRPGMVKNYIRENPDIFQHLDKNELTQINALLDHFGKIPALPPVGGAQHGAGRVLGRGMVGGALGYVSGQVMPGVNSGTAASVGSAVAAYAPMLIARLTMTEQGRSLLLKAMDKGPFLDFPKLAVLAAASRAGLLEPRPEHTKPTLTPGNREANR